MQTKLNINIEESWLNVLKPEFEKPYFLNIKKHLIAENSDGKTIYPPASKIFNAFNFTPFNKVKIVIIGQDPYHGFNQANGLCFSVKKGVKLPPSLKNIFKELKNTIPNFEMPENGDLTSWAKQGVFLLNAILTVRANNAASHKKIGWQTFTDTVIKTISDKKENIIFMLWGNFAKKKSELIDEKKHTILKAAHPSPFSAYNGFFGCNHFKIANKVLHANDKIKINWRV